MCLHYLAKLPNTKHITCTMFSMADCRWLWKEPVVYSSCSKWCPFAFTHARSRALHWSTALSMIDALWNASRDTITVTWKTCHFCYFTSEQNKVSKSDVVEKVIHVADFWMSADSAVSMWYSYILIDILRNISISIDIDIDTPAIVARQSGAKTQCSIYQYCYLQ